METSYAPWTREHLAMAVDSYLALLESQKVSIQSPLCQPSLCPGERERRAIG